VEILGPKFKNFSKHQGPKAVNPEIKSKGRGENCIWVGRVSGLAMEGNTYNPVFQKVFEFKTKLYELPEDSDEDSS